MKLQKARLWSLRIAWALTIGVFGLSFYSTSIMLHDKQTFDVLFTAGAVLAWPLIISWLVTLILHSASG